MKYVSVIVDNNTDATDVLYTYKTELEDIAVGQKVLVPFSIHNRKAEGYVAALSDQAPEGIAPGKIKAVSEIVPGVQLSEEAVKAIAALSPGRIVYVSCDSATLGRDIRRLSEHGYTLTDAAAVDMFPRTGHVETVVRLSR